eukprot:scaffold213749_cov39-Tisochrysis_lutea.AAC.1
MLRHDVALFVEVSLTTRHNAQVYIVQSGPDRYHLARAARYLTLAVASEEGGMQPDNTGTDATTEGGVQHGERGTSVIASRSRAATPTCRTSPCAPPSLP